MSASGMPISLIRLNWKESNFLMLLKQTNTFDGISLHHIRMSIPLPDSYWGDNEGSEFDGVFS